MRPAKPTLLTAVARSFLRSVGSAPTVLPFSRGSDYPFSIIGCPLPAPSPRTLSSLRQVASNSRYGRGCPGSGEEEDPSLRAFLEWGGRNAVPLDSSAIQPASSSGGLPLSCGNDDVADAYLRAISEAVRQSSADVVIISEGFHNCAEMMRLHHRIVQHLVAECGFNTVVTESGLPESREIHDYVLGEGGAKDVEKNEKGKEEMWRAGLNKMYSAWEEGRELIRWMRGHNRWLCQEGGGGDDLLHYYGSDIVGFYSDWRPPVSKIMRYLREVDAAFEAQWMGRVQPLLEIMGTQAQVNYQKKLTKAQRSEMSHLLNELVRHFDANELTFASRHCRRAEFEWARQSAISMKLAEQHYRNYEARSGEGPALEWEDGGIGLNVREIAMANNIMWAMGLRPKAKVIVISHVIHNKMETQYQDELWGFLVPMGQILRQRLKEAGKTAFVVGTTYGRGKFWNRWQKGPEERYLDDVPPPWSGGIERIMRSIGEGKDCFLHWERAPLEATPFLWRTLLMRENDDFIKLRPAEWNACIHLESVSGASPASSLSD